jgi:hypothetical protein
MIFSNPWRSDDDDDEVQDVTPDPPETNGSGDDGTQLVSNRFNNNQVKKPVNPVKKPVSKTDSGPSKTAAKLTTKYEGKPRSLNQSRRHSLEQNNKPPKSNSARAKNYLPDKLRKISPNISGESCTGEKMTKIGGKKISIGSGSSLTKSGKRGKRLDYSAIVIQGPML